MKAYKDLVSHKLLQSDAQSVLIIAYGVCRYRQHAAALRWGWEAVAPQTFALTDFFHLSSLTKRRYVANLCITHLGC